VRVLSTLVDASHLCFIQDPVVACSGAARPYFLLGAHANFSVWHQVASLSLLARYFLSCDFSRQLLSTGEGFSRNEYLAAAVVLRAHALFFCLRWFQSYRALL
jgi:hypothetical protein